jgi:predicted lipid-binding transport protein (Tim44 family)
MGVQQFFFNVHEFFITLLLCGVIGSVIGNKVDRYLQARAEKKSPTIQSSGS